MGNARKDRAAQQPCGVYLVPQGGIEVVDAHDHSDAETYPHEGCQEHVQSNPANLRWLLVKSARTLNLEHLSSGSVQDFRLGGGDIALEAEIPIENGSSARSGFLVAHEVGTSICQSNAKFILSARQ
jgi:hypothetical protein